MRKKGQLDITVHQIPFVVAGAIIISLIALAVVYFYISPSLANTPQARASLDAHTLAFYIASLSEADEGNLIKNLNDTSIVQIGQYSGFTRVMITKPTSNYFIKVFLYDKNGKQIAESEEVSFVGNVDVKCEKPGICMTTERVSFIKMTKNPDGPVKIEGMKEALETGLGECKQVTSSEIQSYVEKYSSQYKVEKYFVLAVMAAESSLQQCDRYGVTLHSVVNGVPKAFGLMQMTPATARGLESQFGVQINVEDAEQNVMAGVLLLSTLLKNYDGYDDQLKLAAANYNCGGIDDAVAKYCKDKKGCWEKIKPYLGRDEKDNPKEFCGNSNETIPYVEKSVIPYYNCFKSCMTEGKMCYTMSVCAKARLT